MNGIEMPMSEHMLPQFTLRSNDLPEVAKWEVGDKYYVVMKIEMVGKQSHKEGNMTSMEGDFKMHSIKALGTEPVDAKSLEAKEFTAMVNKVKSGQA